MSTLAHPRRTEAKARPTVTRRGGLLIGLAVLLATTGVQPAFGAAPPNPVILVHGCIFHISKSIWSDPQARGSFLEVYWAPMLEAFRAANYPAERIHVMQFKEPCGDNAGNATQLAGTARALLMKNRSSKVDLVGHSMACLSTRRYIASFPNQVDDVVHIAGICHGTDIPDNVLRIGTLNGENRGFFDMAVPYACSGIQKTLNGCFDPTTGKRSPAWPPFNETPGTASVLSIYTETDDLVRPPHSACLNQQSRGDCTNPVNRVVTARPHLSIHQDPDLAAAAVAFCR
jgi:pimeloyl-ACP methyl ester carboxylesterase